MLRPFLHPSKQGHTLAELCGPGAPARLMTSVSASQHLQPPRYPLPTLRARLRASSTEVIRILGYHRYWASSERLVKKLGLIPDLTCGCKEGCVKEEWRVTWDCRDREGHSRQRKQRGQRFERLRKEVFHVTGRRRVRAAVGKEGPCAG